LEAGDAVGGGQDLISFELKIVFESQHHVWLVFYDKNLCQFSPCWLIKSGGGTHATPRRAFATPPETPLARRRAARAAVLCARPALLFAVVGPCPSIVCPVFRGFNSRVRSWPRGGPG